MPLPTPFTAVADVSKLVDAHTIRIYPTPEMEAPIVNAVKEESGETSDEVIGTRKAKRLKKKGQAPTLSGAGGKEEPFITVPIPPTFQLDLVTQYKNYFEQGLTGASHLKTVLNTLGLSATFKWSNIETWDSSDPLEFSIPLELVARRNAFNEVYMPVVRLMALASPDVKRSATLGGVLLPPGPNALKVAIEEGLNTLELFTPENKTGEVAKEFAYKGLKGLKTAADNLQRKITGTNQTGRTIRIEIGNFLNINNLILRSVNPTFQAGKGELLPMNYFGMPLRASVQLKFQGTRIFTANKDSDRDLNSAESMAAWANPLGSNSDVNAQGKQVEEEHDKLFSKQRVSNFYSKLLTG